MFSGNYKYHMCLALKLTVFSIQNVFSCMLQTNVTINSDLFLDNSKRLTFVTEKQYVHCAAGTECGHVNSKHLSLLKINFT